MIRKCQITGKYKNKAYKISHSHVRTSKTQNVNLHKKRIWLVKENKWIRLRVSAKSLKLMGLH